MLERLSRPAVRCGHRPAPTARRCWRRSSGPGLFLVPLDEVRGWWRYHHLFADLLARHACRQQQPGAGAGAAPHRGEPGTSEHGLPDDAIRHALAAGETTWAARLIEQHFEEQILAARRGRDASDAGSPRCRPRLIRPPAGCWPWGRPRSRLDGRPAGRGRTAAGRWRSRRFDQAADEPYRASIDRGAQPAGERAGRRSRSRAPTWPACAVTPKRERQFAQAALEQLTEHDELLGTRRPLPRGVRGLDRRAPGRPRNARWPTRLRRAGRVGAARPGAACGLRPGRGSAGPGTAGRGAARPTERALEVAAEHRVACRPSAWRTSGWPRWATRGTSCPRPPSMHAMRHRAVPPARLRPALVAGLVTLAWIRQAEGDPVGALDAIDEAGRPRCPRRWSTCAIPCPALRARLVLARGQPRRGRALGPAAAGWLWRTSPSIPASRSTCLLARLLLAEHRPAAGPRAAGAVAGAGRRPGPGRRRAPSCASLEALRTRRRPATRPPR